GMSQPPLSDQVRQLEAELGVELFQRTSRHVELTAAGKAFLDKARSILGQVEGATQAAQQAQRGERGQLDLGFMGTFSIEGIPQIVRAIRKRYPAMEVVLHSMPPGEQVRALLSRRIEVRFFRRPARSEELAW